jgi:hypothetical protein
MELTGGSSKMKLSDFVNSGASGLASIFSTFTAAEAIASGDIISQGTDGTVYWASDPNAADVHHPLVLTSPTYNVPVNQIANNATVINRLRYASTSLTNGNCVVVSIVSTGLYFEIFQSTGATVVGPTLIDGVEITETTYPTGGVSVIELAGGGFAVGYLNATNAMLAIYSNTGAVVSAPQIAVATGKQAVKLCQISNGNIVVFVGFITPSDLAAFAIFSSVGVSVVAATSVGGQVISVAYAVDIVPAGTGFFLAWSAWNGSSYVYYAIYSATGTVVSAAADISGNGGAAVANVQVVATIYGFCVMYSGINASSNLGTFIWAYNAAGTLIGDVSVAGGQSNGARMIATGGGVGVYGVGSGNQLQYSWYSGTGPTATTQATGITLASGGFGMNCQALNNGYILVSTAAGETVIMNAGAPMGAAALLGNSGASDIAVFPVTAANLGLPASSGPGWLVFLNNRIQVMIFNVVTRSPVGVAVAAAAAGAPVSAQVLGGTTGRLSFGRPYSIDARNFALPGQCMSVTGNAVIMQGIQPPSANRRPIN